MPNYGLQRVDELPANAPSGRNNMYVGLLKPLTEQEPGDWYQIAQFKTPTGARNAEKAIEEQKRPIPPGDWEFETRRVTNPEDPTGNKHSVLYARYLGSGVATEAFEDAEG